MDLVTKVIELERRLAMVEANRGASLRFGTVTESNAAGSARVELHDGDGMVSRAVRTLQRRTLKDQDQCLPDLGEQVAVLFAGQGMEEGCILGAVYSGNDPAPGQAQPMEYYRFADGTVLSYDREAHKLYRLVKGEVDITVEKDVKVVIQGNASVTVQGEADVQVAGDASIHTNGHGSLAADKTLTLTGRKGVSLYGPSIRWRNLDGSAETCRVNMEADVYHTGLMDHKGFTEQRGNVSMKGDMEQSGSQSVSGNINAGGTVTGHPVRGCRH